MTSEQKLHDALVAYQTAMATARSVAQASVDELKGDILVTTLSPWNTLVGLTNDMDYMGVNTAIAALEARAAAASAG